MGAELRHCIGMVPSHRHAADCDQLVAHEYQTICRRAVIDLYNIHGIRAIAIRGEQSLLEKHAVAAGRSDCQCHCDNNVVATFRLLCLGYPLTTTT